MGPILSDWESCDKAVRVRHAEWASPGVPMPKKDGSIRYCVDFKTTLNPQLRTDHYPLPRPDNVFAQISKGVYFTSLDLKDAYMQLKLDEESQELCIVNTHKGYYKLKRLLYGISSSAAIFQNVMDDILQGLSGVICYLDNILIQGSTLSECVQRTLLVLGRLDKHNVRINLNKCQWFVEEFEFLGFVIRHGVRAQAPSITAAVMEFPTPKNSKPVHSFLGLLTFYHNFIPMCSTVTKPLRNLLKTNVPFSLTSECQEAFIKCKSLLVSNDLLVLYDPDLPIVVYCDVGVGAVLCHTVIVNGKPVDKPVMYASSSLTDTQQRYAQIDREGLAVIFAVSKFHKFLWGRQFTLVTDNYAIHRIFHSNKGLPVRTGHRLQHWAAILQAYNYVLVHRKCEFLRAADALSRLPTSVLIDDVLHVKILSPLPLTAEVIAAETVKDPILSQVLKLVFLGWPTRAKYSPESGLSPYFKLRDQLTIRDQCLLFASRVVVPLKLQAEVLKLLHAGHPGIVRSKALARSVVWWPPLNDDIVLHCKNCVPCTVANFSPSKEYVPWPKAIAPFSRVHIDFFEYKSLTFFILVDAYSRWLHVSLMSNGTNAKEVNAVLLSIFSVYGLATSIVSDNGPPFDSNEYTEFCTSFNIQVFHSPVYHPESNGLAEKGVDIAKEGIKKDLDKAFSDPNVVSDLALQEVSIVLQKFLFNYRNTPTSVDLKSPNDLLFAYKPATLLTMLLPGKSLNTNVQFREGEIVFLKLHRRSPTVQGTITRVISPLRYQISVEGVLKEVHHNQLVRSPTL